VEEACDVLLDEGFVFKLQESGEMYVKHFGVEHLFLGQDTQSFTLCSNRESCAIYFCQLSHDSVIAHKSGPNLGKL
jgi:hypothetical protein